MPRQVVILTTIAPMHACYYCFPIDIKNAFELTQNQLKTKCILSLGSVEDMNAWVKEVKTLVKEFQKKKAKEMAQAQAKKKAEEDGPVLPPGTIPIALAQTVSSPMIMRR
jgi:hypothetical protein